MAVRIFKYQPEFTMADRAEVELPLGARIIYAAMQNNRITFWAEVDEEAETEVRVFHVRGTGHIPPFEEGGVHVGSMLDGPFVWHLYIEQGEEPDGK